MSEPGRPGPAEMALLLAVAGSERSAHTRSTLEGVLTAPLSWEIVQRHAEHHDLEALLHRHLSELSSLVPDGVSSWIVGRARAIARRNLFLTSELVELLSALEDAGIRALPFKGPIAASHYASPALRSFGDLDVVVSPDQKDEAIRLLEARSFRRWHERTDASEYALPFDRGDGALCVDLHWGFARTWFGAALEFDRLWEGGVSVRLANRDVRTFAPADQLLHLCVHGAKHGPTPWPKIKWVVDASELLRAHRDHDWQGAVEKASSMGCVRMLALGVALVRDVLERPVPEALSATLAREGAVRRQVPLITAGWWSDDPMDLGDRLRFDLATRERRGDRWAYLWRRLVTPQRSDRDALGLGDPDTPLYRPLRVLRLAVRYGLRPSRLKRLLDR